MEKSGLSIKKNVLAVFIFTCIIDYSNHQKNHLFSVPFF